MSSINTQSLARRVLSVAQQKPEPYFQLEDKWPEYSFVQRIQASIATPERLSFTAKSVDPNLFLRSKASLKLQVSFQNEELDDNLVFLINSPINNNSVIYKKPGNVIANSIIEMNLRLNNIGINLKEPRYWQKYITAQHAGETITENYLSTSGSSYPDWDGSTGVNSGYPQELAGDNARILNDKGIDQAAEAVFQETGLAPGDQSTISYNENLNIGCFNFLDEKKGEIYSKSWYKNMSSLIPYVKQLGLDISLHDLAANTLVYLYSRRTIPDAPQPRISRLTAINIVSAELVLKWVRPRPEKIFGIPQQVNLQSFFVDHKEFQINSGNVVDFQTNSAVDIQNLSIHQVPAYIIFYATIDKDSVNYDCISISTSRDIAGLDGAVLQDVNSQESHLQLVDNTFRLRG